jgi:DNA polymerase IIIc chi subunit
MRKSSISTASAAAAELALKAHVCISTPEILADVSGGNRMMQEVADVVDLTDAPEDAVCSLVIDLLQFCEREKIDWNNDVMRRAWEHFRSEPTEMSTR